MTLPRIELLPAGEDDFEALLVLRMAAMRQSLEQLKRFDPQLARERLSRGFSVANTRHIVVDGRRVGFVVVIPREKDWLLENFYLQPEEQGRGVGGLALRLVLAEADAINMPVSLTSLKLNDAANRFYQRHGFVLWDESEWDMHFWRPARGGQAQRG